MLRIINSLLVIHSFHNSTSCPYFRIQFNLKVSGDWMAFHVIRTMSTQITTAMKSSNNGWNTSSPILYKAPLSQLGTRNFGRHVNIRSFSFFRMFLWEWLSRRAAAIVTPTLATVKTLTPNVPKIKVRMTYSKWFWRGSIYTHVKYTVKIDYMLIAMSDYYFKYCMKWLQQSTHTLLLLTRP